MNNRQERPIVLSIAGFDPSGGAGVLADAKTLEQLGVQGMAVLTANTVQTEDTFSYIDWVASDVIQKGIKALMQRYVIPVVKIGIVQDAALLKAIIASVYQYNPHAFILWAPVLKSSSGFTFFQEEDLDALYHVGLNHIDLITPNFEEYQILQPHLSDHFTNALLIKGGHRKDHKGVDRLQQGHCTIDLYPRVDNVYPKHGSGCVLSAAIAAHMASGQCLEEACRQAKAYTEQFLNSHSSLLGFHHYAE